MSRSLPPAPAPQGDGLCLTLSRMKEFAYIHEEGKLPDLLANIPFFEQFSAGHLNDILYSSYFVQCDPGDRIIEQGQEDKRIFILLAGELEVLKDGEPVGTLTKNGEIFGEVAVVSGERRIATVRALTPALCLVIDQQFLHELKPEETNASYYAAMYGFLSRVMAVRLQAVSARLAEVERELEVLKAARGVVRPKAAERLPLPAPRTPKGGTRVARGKPASKVRVGRAAHQASRKTSRKK
ncbi:MAG: cyclic nucleotide-binding domain-containing protein [Verrucomicrobiales bacterium]